MQIRRASGTSPFGHVIFLKKGEVDGMCEDALRAAKFLPSEPAAINIESFIEQHFECLLDFGTDLGGDVLGVTVFSPKGKPELVGISPTLDDGSKVAERRIRATLAHEAGHCLLHPILFMEDGERRDLLNTNLDFAQRRILCRKTDINPAGKYDGRWWEFQANCAIGGFLLPRKLIAKCVTPLLTTTGLLGGQSLKGTVRQEAEQLVANTFEVNPAVARIRLGELYPESAHPEL